MTDTTPGTDLEQRLRVAEAALEEVRADRARLWEEVNRLRAERQDVDYFKRLAASMEGSASWKVTAPLRSAKALAGKVRNRLGEQRG